MIEWPSEKLPLVDLRLDVDPLDAVELARGSAISISLSKWPMLPTIAWCFIRAMCVGGDDVAVAGGGDEDVGGLDDVLERGDLVALHRGLQRADRVDLGDDDAGALAAQRLRAALADVAVAEHDGDLAADHHVGARG